MHPSLSDPRCHQPLPEGPLAEHSRFYQRLHRRYANDLPLLPPGAPVLAVPDQRPPGRRATLIRPPGAP